MLQTSIGYIKPPNSTEHSIHPVSALPQSSILRIAVDINPLSLAPDIARIALGISEGDLVAEALVFMVEYILIIAVSTKILGEKLMR